MTNKQLNAAIRRLKDGVPVYLKKCSTQHKHATFSFAQTGRGTFQGTIICHTDFGDSFVSDLFEAGKLNTLRKIACGYYPSLCKHFGPARQFAEV